MHPLICDFLMRVRPAQLGDAIKHLLRVKRVETPLRGGGVLLVDPVTVMGMTLRREHAYEPLLTSAVSQLLRPNDVFIDVGANEGYFTVCAAVRGAEVHAFEPQSRLRPVFEANVRRNCFANVHLHSVALSDREGSVDLYLRPSTISGASSIFRYWKLGDAMETVPTATFDSVAQDLGRQIRLMKIDCEGAEEVVVRGSKNTIAARRVDHIALEFHPAIIGEQRCTAIDKSIREKGYVATVMGTTCFYSLPERTGDLAAVSEPPH